MGLGKTLQVRARLNWFSIQLRVCRRLSIFNTQFCFVFFSQVISFCDVFLRYTEGRTVLCVMPINTLQNWVAEFNMWLPVDADSSPAKEHGEVLPRKFPLFVLNDNHKTLSARTKVRVDSDRHDSYDRKLYWPNAPRFQVIQNWYKDGGVLLIGYELYRQLSLKKVAKSRTRSKKRFEAEEDLDDDKSKSLLDRTYYSERVS